MQNFRKILDLTPDNNPQDIDIITGIKLYNGKLIINALEFYDAPANNTHTTLVLNDASNIANSTVNGYYSFEGAAHMAGWISSIPTEWQSLLGGNYLAGNSSRYAINSRLTQGVSAFVFDPSLVNGSPSGVISTTKLLDYDLGNPLYADYDSYERPNYNLTEVNGSTPSGHTFEDANAVVGNNSLWTESSQTSYGFIVPGTSTYLTIGSSGGHESGIGYKATQNNGNTCGGPCAYNADDYYNYYWLWDVNDLLSVKNGTKNHFDIRPYAYGIFNAPFQTDLYKNTSEFHPIYGGTYDSVSGLLYLTIYDGAATGPYDKNPVIAAYKINSATLLGNSLPKNNTVSISPNPASEYFLLSYDKTQLNIKSINLFDSNGRLMKSFISNDLLNVSGIASGFYFFRVQFSDNTFFRKKVIIK